MVQCHRIHEARVSSAWPSERSGGDALPTWDNSAIRKHERAAHVSAVKGACAMARSVRSGSVRRSSSASKEACSRALCRACRSSRLLRASMAAMS